MIPDWFQIPAPPPVADNTPFALKLIVTNKNPEVHRKYLINQECVFEEVRTCLRHLTATCGSSSSTLSQTL